MMHQIMKPESRERGASVIEFAVVLPLLLIILFGIVEFGIMFYDKAMLTNAAREGARYGIVLLGEDVSGNPIRHEDTDIIGVVTAYCGTHLVSLGVGATPTVTVTVNRAGPASLQDLTVHVQYPYSFLLLPNFLTFLSPTLTLHAEVVMKNE
ncbi:MAG: pilus assembly protein [Desulfobulbaceae bacterium]|nr:pilus assembly protein [Desulfobulbaceae bacterium]